MSVRELYEELVVLKKIERDPAQGALLSRLEQVEERVVTHRSARRVRPVGWLFGSSQPEPVKGLYVFGDVGRGKTMLMDLFFEASPVVRKRRAHFHEFMADIHERVRAYREVLDPSTQVGIHARLTPALLHRRARKEIVHPLCRQHVLQRRPDHHAHRALFDELLKNF
jgi:predicted ATPase